jgi:hypothetical protein
VGWHRNLRTAPYDRNLVFAYEFGRIFFYMGQLNNADLVMREDWSHISITAAP